MTPSPTLSSKLLVLLRGLAVLVIGLVVGCQISATDGPHALRNHDLNGEAFQIHMP